ncbi:uncharacterized protein B0I36DRAFT_369115 [Microdochium trichocladiopsis]|uniref:Uncharacterized protein n=1 Tax=Microdochium trichocladiopsis TaxID=1682393 RepID=A0A9P8XRL9_9PEZI|nr:uncharacterized protein B0I36DRAFT_369115 [Microdochium trichocladiopsis]KAH7014122.1 hypothetical protein B0I36DRAFT_369115 [Microdochium trichocladiopsis]
MIIGRFTTELRTDFSVEDFEEFGRRVTPLAVGYGIDSVPDITVDAPAIQSDLAYEENGHLISGMAAWVNDEMQRPLAFLERMGGIAHRERRRENIRLALATGVIAAVVALYVERGGA